MTEQDGNILDLDEFRRATGKPTIVFKGERYEAKMLTFNERIELLRATSEYDQTQLDQALEVGRIVCEKVDFPFDVLTQMCERDYYRVLNFLSLGTAGYSPEEISLLSNAPSNGSVSEAPPSPREQS